MTRFRRELTHTQWLEALGIDPFWIVNEAEEPAQESKDDTPLAYATVSINHPNKNSALSDRPVALCEHTTASDPAQHKPSAVPPRMAEDAQYNDWPQLEAQIRQCQACPLHLGRQQAVPGVGDRQASWLFVGEGPGAEEDKTGLPFVGKAGQLLDAMLAALDLQRGKDVYIANAVKCRPPGNRTPEKAEIDACRGYLAQQIAWIQPKVIVILGKPAAYAVLGKEESIQSLRGAVHRYKCGDLDIPVVVTYHPAYLLRQPAEKRKAWQDLLLAQQAIEETTE